MTERSSTKRSLWPWVDRMLDRLFAVAGAFLFSQFPMFVQQYVQRLAGHIDELAWYVQKLDRMAQASHQTLAQYINRFQTNTDALVVSQGKLMEEMVARQKGFIQSYEAINHVSVYMKPFSFLRHVDSVIAKSTFVDFIPGFVMNMEGIFYAILGLFSGYLLYRLIMTLFLAAKHTLLFVFGSRTAQS